MTSIHVCKEISLLSLPRPSQAATMAKKPAPPPSVGSTLWFLLRQFGGGIYCILSTFWCLYNYSKAPFG